MHFTRGPGEPNLLIAVSLVNQRGDEILCQNVPMGGTGVYFCAFAYKLLSAPILFNEEASMNLGQ